MTRGFFTALTGLVLIALVAAAVPARPLSRGGCSGGSCSPGFVCGPNGCSVVYPTSAVYVPSSPLPAASPVSALQPSASAPVAEPLHGVDRSKGVGLVDALQIGPADASKIGADVGKVTLPEDAHKPFVVIVGDKAYQQKARNVVSDSGIDKLMHVVSYAEDQFQAKGVGYSKGVWLVNGRDEEDRGEVFSYDEDPEAMRGPLKRIVDKIRKPDGSLDKGVLSNLARMVDPGAYAWKLFMVCIGPMLNLAMVALLIVAVVRH